MKEDPAHKGPGGRDLDHVGDQAAMKQLLLLVSLG